MFFIFNKDKIVSYVVTVFTVIVLFVTASVFTRNEESMQTSANESKIYETNNIIDNNITKENTINNIN